MPDYSKTTADVMGGDGDATIALIKRVSSLEQKLTQLTHVNHALWELLKERSKMTDEHLVKKVEDIIREAEEVADAKVKCHACHKDVPAARDTCLYCGAQIKINMGKKPFDI